MNFFKTKPNMLQQDFHRGNNPAYDRVAFVAEHYEELVFMYKDILEHLKQGGTGGGTGGGCTRISKQIESPYGFVQLDKESFKLMGYDLDNPDDIQFLLHNTLIGVDDSYAYATSNGMEYHDTYEVNVGELDTLFVRDPDLDNFLDNLLSNPSMLEKNFWKINIHFDVPSRDISITRDYIQSYTNKEMFLLSLYKELSRQAKTELGWLDYFPIRLDIFNAFSEKVYTKTSDSEENNPIYTGKTSGTIATYNNVVLFPVESPYISYAQTYAFHIKYMTTPYLREVISVSGQGDIITCKEDTKHFVYLSADLPVIEYSPTDMHTFTYTIDPDIKDDC